MKYPLGTKLRLLVDMHDDDDDKERMTPAGSIIEVTSYDARNPDNPYIVGCHETGGWIFASEPELDRIAELAPVTPYKSQSARDAQARGYGDRRYWNLLDRGAIEMHDYYLAQGDHARAKHMLTRSLGEALRGNNGD